MIRKCPLIKKCKPGETVNGHRCLCTENDVTQEGWGYINDDCPICQRCVRQQSVEVQRDA